MFPVILGSCEGDRLAWQLHRKRVTSLPIFRGRVDRVATTLFTHIAAPAQISFWQISLQNSAGEKGITPEHEIFVNAPLAGSEHLNV